MNCRYCGAELPEEGAYCPRCGKAADRDDGMECLVKRARAGDREAVAALYERTYSKVYYTVKAMIKNESDVYDILQDAYIKAFTHLDSLEGGGKFLPWVRQIAANTARDWLKKQRPMLFADLHGGEEQDAPEEERLADERDEHIPEVVIDQEETARLVKEIIDELPEDQRAVIGMFYYEELSVKEIADALGVTESAVKSRLLYGRRKIEKKVRELEKRGTKLYGLAPIPFLLLLLRQNACAASNGQILQNVLAAAAKPAASAAGSGAAGAKAGGAGAHGAGHAAAGIGSVKVGAMVLAAVAVVGAGTFGAVRLAQRAEAPSTVAAADPADVSDAGVSETPGGEEPEADTAVEEALAAYRTIVGQADSYSYASYSVTPTGKYRYALVQMETEDPVPTLLLSQEGDDGMNRVRVFRYDPDTGAVLQPEDVLEEGVGGGGYRAGLSMEGDGSGIRLTEVSGGTGDADITRVTLSGDTLHRETQWSGRIDMAPEEPGFREITWYPAEDTGALDSWTPDAGETEDAGGETAALEDGDRIVFTGTIGIYSYEEVIALQGCPDPNVPWSDPSQTYPLIVLDTPQTMELQGLDGPRSGEVKLITLFSPELAAQYEGQHLTFSIDPGNTYWPSDASMPVGQPGTSDIHVLG